MFILLLFCFFLVKTALSYMYPEDDFARKIVHLVDTYAGLLGVVGYLMWITLDMYTIVVSMRIRRGSEEVKTHEEA